MSESNLNDLLCCPLCGGEAVWCDSQPDEDGDTHQCDHILCKQCGMTYNLVNEITRNAESFSEAKKEMQEKFNSRAI